MTAFDSMFVNGKWTAPAGMGTVDVENPCTEETISSIRLCDRADVDRAVNAARAAFPAWSAVPVAGRAAFLRKIAEALTARQNEIGDTIAREMGMPYQLARMIQVGLPIAVLNSYADILEKFEFEHPIGGTQIVKEAVGVCGFITPWNYPLHQIIGKVAPALAAGCTMVLKPSQLAPLNAYLLAEVMEQVGLPAGVFNLVPGTGGTVGNALAAHPDVDMVSLTGSTASGALVARAAADTIKRVTLELGGKSANIILDDADLQTAVGKGVFSCFLNSGQTCIALTRMIVPEQKMKQAAEIAKATIGLMKMGDAFEDGVYLGPMVDAAQRQSVCDYIKSGIAEGATLVAGGPERPEGLPKGYFVKPTVFAGVKPGMKIEREEIFGPVLSIIPCRDEDEAVKIANDSEYGLSGCVWSGDTARAQRVARKIRTGQVLINDAIFDVNAPAGGYKKSGIGRERSAYGLEEYLEIKALLGHNRA